VTKKQRDALHEVKKTLEAQAPKGAPADPFEASEDNGRAG
jgi:hypothetical protein